MIIRILGWCAFLFGIYYSIYLYAYNEYDREVSKLEKEINIVENQLNKKNEDIAWKKIPYLQNKFLPNEPQLLDPFSIIPCSITEHFCNRELSWPHVMQLQEIIQLNRSTMANLTFRGLYLTQKYKMKNRKLVQEKYYNDEDNESDLYFNFMHSNFSGSSFQRASFSHLNLSYSNFSKSKHIDSRIYLSNLNSIDLSMSTIDKSILKAVDLQQANLNYSTISSSDFTQSNLKKANIKNSSIQGVNFSETNLLGSDFSNTKFKYKNNNDIIYNFNSSIYNSRPITKNEIIIYKKHSENSRIREIFKFCKLIRSNKIEVNKCHHAIYKIHKSFSVSRATKFPDDFYLQKYKMIDASDFLKFLKQSQ